MENALLKSLLSNDNVFIILSELADKKKATFKELRDSLIGSENNNASNNLENLLKELCKANLIGVVDSQYRDFNSYYLTAQGAQMARRLEGFGKSEKSISAR